MEKLQTHLATSSPAQEQTSAWHGKVGYSILTPTFYDSNGDGIGDIPGVTQKLDYLQNLGVDIIHVTPFFPTHLYDIGYDVDDYENVDPRYGDMESLKGLFDAAHAKGIHVVIDMVLNHTSQHHKWFEESKSSRDNPKRDWYIWRDAQPDGSLPNNWAANFGGDAWQFDEKTDQYYLHTFLPEQPDLNYENPQVIAEMIAIMNRWVELGVDGFRLDSVNFIRKKVGLPDAVPNPEYVSGVSHPNSKVKNEHWWYQPKMLEDLRVLTEATGAFIFSESNPPQSHKAWREKIYRAAKSEKHAMINSTLNGMPWDAEQVMEHLEEFYGMLAPDDIASYQISCHDAYIRTVDRLGELQARNGGLLLYTIPGIPWEYYGDEIGMIGQNVAYDPDNRFQNVTFSRFGLDRTKNPTRLSMPWDNTPNAGFSTHNPALPVPNDYRTHNVQTEMADPSSMYNLRTQLIAHRRNYAAMQAGTFKRLDPHNNTIGAYRLDIENGESVGVAINFSDQEQVASLDYGNAVGILSTIPKKQMEDEMSVDKFTLLPNEGILFKSS